MSSPWTMSPPHCAHGSYSMHHGHSHPPHVAPIIPSSPLCLLLCSWRLLLSCTCGSPVSSVVTTAVKPCPHTWERIASSPHAATAPTPCYAWSATSHSHLLPQLRWAPTSSLTLANTHSSSLSFFSHAHVALVPPGMTLSVKFGGASWV